MFVKIMDLAPAEDDVPVLLVMVAVRLFTDTEKLPSIPVGVPDMAVVPPELKVNPDGNVTIILPLLGMGFNVVKAAVTLPLVPTTSDAGVTLAVVIVAGLTTTSLLVIASAGMQFTVILST